MKYRSRSCRYPQQDIQFYFRTTPFSTKLYVSRNGIFLDIIASISVQQQLLLIAINYSRLMFWLNKGIKINTFTSSSTNTTFRTFLFPNLHLKK